MLGLFLNPGFLFIGIALISVPIIIHLINRMRFKRIRWAAMEFLLKAQKRTRRRLIIEQLILLALRCLLIFLVLLLVSRFIGCGDTNVGGKANLHVVLLDDSPSMLDQWKLPDGTHNCFEIAKEEILIKKFAKNLSLSKTNDKFIILPNSKISDPEYQRKVYENLNDSEKLKELERHIRELKASMVHANLLEGVKDAQKLMGDFKESQVRLHLIGDLRQPDWGLPNGEGLNKALGEMAKNNRDMKIRIIDTVHPARAANQGGFPPSRDNVGIVDFRPNTRIVGKNMPVQFTVAIQNFSGKQIDAMLVARNENTGADMREVSFNVASREQGGARIANTFTLSPASVTIVTFEHRFNPTDMKPGEPYFAHLSVRLTNPQLQSLDNESLLADNLRHTVVEVRERVPILVIDGSERTDRMGRRKPEEDLDSFYVSRSLISVPGASYQVVYGEDLAGGIPTKALERADLLQFPTIFLLNVAQLSPKQLTNLENYVRDGGGLAVFLGPQINTVEWYNKQFYKDGKGIFPAPLKGTFPLPGDKDLESTGGDTFKLLIRDEKFADPRLTPIFGAMFEEPKHREPLRNLPIRRYFQVNRSAWKQDAGRVFELATMPNESAAKDSYQGEVTNITTGANATGIYANAELKKYHGRLKHHLDNILVLVDPTSEAKAYHVAAEIDKLFADKGIAKKEGSPDMTELFANPDSKVQSLRLELMNLRELVSFGDPFVVTGNFGKGKTVAVMSTAGKDWNDWAGGSAASVLYAPFIWEMQNYLSSQGDEANLSVGAVFDVSLDASQFQGAQLKMVRKFRKTQEGKNFEEIDAGTQFGKADGTQVGFTLNRNLEPGVYVSKVYDETNPQKGPVATYAHAFNIDTTREGQLARVGSDELDRELISKGERGQIAVVTLGGSDSDIVGKIEDFSESPWLFLIFLFVLVAEQALAVHLSFHMRDSEDATAAATTGVSAKRGV